MDISKILKHSVELLQMRNEDTEDFETELFEIDTNRFYNEAINCSTKNITVIYTFSKDAFKEFWSNIRTLTIDEIEELYNTRKFIVIMQEYPASVTLQTIQNKNTQMLAENGFIQLFLMKELMFNPMKHILVPKHVKLTEPEVKTLLENLQLKSKTQLPFIQRNDTIARWLGLQQGDIVKITRHPETSGEYYYYRCCV